MALVKATLQAQLLKIFTEMRNETENADAKLAEKLASAITDNFGEIQGATVWKE